MLSINNESDGQCVGLGYYSVFFLVAATLAGFEKGNGEGGGNNIIMVFFSFGFSYKHII